MKKDGLALRFVNEQTPKICFEAVRQNGYALEYVENQTIKCCLEAIKQDGTVFSYLEKQMEEYCLSALFQNPHSFNQISEPTKEMEKIYKILSDDQHQPPYSYQESRLKRRLNQICSDQSPYEVLGRSYY